MSLKANSSSIRANSNKATNSKVVANKHMVKIVVNNSSNSTKIVGVSRSSTVVTEIKADMMIVEDSMTNSPGNQTNTISNKDMVKTVSKIPDSRDMETSNRDMDSNNRATDSSNRATDSSKISNNRATEATSGDNSNKANTVVKNVLGMEGKTLRLRAGGNKWKRNGVNRSKNVRTRWIFVKWLERRKMRKTASAALPNM